MPACQEINNLIGSQPLEQQPARQLAAFYRNLKVYLKLRVTFVELIEVFARQNKQRGICECRGCRGTGPVLNQGHLAEVIVLHQNGKLDLFVILPADDAYTPT